MLGPRRTHITPSFAYEGPWQAILHVSGHFDEGVYSFVFYKDSSNLLRAYVVWIVPRSETSEHPCSRKDHVASNHGRFGGSGNTPSVAITYSDQPATLPGTDSEPSLPCFIFQEREDHQRTTGTFSTWNRQPCRNNHLAPPPA